MDTNRKLACRSSKLLATVAICFSTLLTGCVDPDFGKKPEKERTTPAKSQAGNTHVAANGNLNPQTPTPKPQPPGNDDVTPPPQQQTAPQQRQPVVRTPRYQPTSRPQVNAMPIRLSAGAALPQSLPGGTAMSFSAEYQFTSGGPNSAARYAWVIQGRGGKTVRVGLRSLKTRGQLPAYFTRGFRPEDKPFRCFIEEWPASRGRQKPGAGKRVSNIIPLS